MIILLKLFLKNINEYVNNIYMNEEEILEQHFCGRKEFANFIKMSKIPIILKFTADWCGPCKRIQPYCHEVFKSLNQKIICFDLNIQTMVKQKIMELFWWNNRSQLYCQT